LYVIICLLTFAWLRTKRKNTERAPNAMEPVLRIWRFDLSLSLLDISFRRYSAFTTSVRIKKIQVTAMPTPKIKEVGGNTAKNEINGRNGGKKPLTIVIR
jgi:hypothetical protein